jgi:hypothetical protein
MTLSDSAHQDGPRRLNFMAPLMGRTVFPGQAGAPHPAYVSANSGAALILGAVYFLWITDQPPTRQSEVI